jgi:4a-hydroxytetrahydrobiopterin dehydratase
MAKNSYSKIIQIKILNLNFRYTEMYSYSAFHKLSLQRTLIYRIYVLLLTGYTMSDIEYRKLSEAEIKNELDKLDGWKVVSGKLSRTLQFENFIQAFSFMTKVALEAEKMNHHPEWFNVYDRLDISLVTHDLKGISTYDIKLARTINQLYLR